VGDDDTSLRQQVFDIPVAQVEAVIEPDGVLDDLRRKAVALVLSDGISHPGDGRASLLNLAVPITGTGITNVYDGFGWLS
jgi:hypothetical protein